MNKTDLIGAIAEDTELTKVDCEKAVNSFISIVSDTLADREKVQLIGFGTYSVVKRKARLGRNPSNGKPIKIKASKAVKFKPGKKLKEAVN